MSEVAPEPSSTVEHGSDDDMLALARATDVFREADPAPKASGSDAIVIPMSRRRAREVTPGLASTEAVSGDEELVALVDEAIRHGHDGAAVLAETVGSVRRRISTSAESSVSSLVDPIVVDTAAARVMVAPVVEELVASHPDTDPVIVADAAHTIIEAGEAAGEHTAKDKEPKEPLSDAEKAFYQKLAFVIQKRIMSELDSDEVAEAFKNGGSDAYFKLLNERFAANERLRVIAEWLGKEDAVSDEPKDPTDSPDPTLPPTTPTSSPAKPVRRKIGVPPVTKPPTPRPRRKIVATPPTSPVPGTVDPAVPPTPDADPAAELEAAAKYAEGIEHGERLSEALDIARQRLAKITVEQRARGWSRKGLHEEFQAAEEEYNRLYLQISTEAVKYLRELDPPMSEDEIRARVCGGIVEEKMLLDRMRYRAVESSSDKKISKPYKKFCAWYEKQKGTKGFVAKSLVFAVPAAVLAGGGAVLGVGGLLSGALMVSTRVARGTMISKISARGSDKHIANDQQDTTKLMHQTMAELNSVAVDDLANYAVHSQTRANRYRINADQQTNRRRVRHSIGASAVGMVLGATAGGYVADKIGNVFGKATDMVQDRLNGGSGTGVASEVTPSGGRPFGFDPNVIVEQGNGYTHELQDLTASKGITLNSSESYQLYEYLEGRHSGDLIDQVGSYQMGGDYGIASPGNGTWKPEVLKDVNEWLRLNGKTA